jgi:zinc/manganese transport system substrate-binding protein
MANAFAQAEAAGVRRFVAADHLALRHVGAGEGTNPSDPDQAKGAADPHLWMDPLTVRQAMDALAAELPADLRIDVSGRQRDLDARLAALDGEVAGILSAIPDAHRTLVTGHESMGYFAQRYRLRLVGAIVPSLTSAAAPAAADLAALADQVKALGVPAIFTELGTSPDVAQALASETGARVVELATHVLPVDGSYSTFMTTIAHLVADNLR